MTERNNGFILVDSPNQLAQIGCGRIAQLLGKSIQDIDPREVALFANAYVALSMGERSHMSSRDYQRLLRTFTPSITCSEREKAEFVQGFLQASDLINPENLTVCSYGLYSPSYITALEKQKEVWRSPEYLSLLIGSFTIETGIEYTSTVRHVFPHAKTYIVDIEGEQTKQAPGFIYANGTAIPFATGSMSSVHTNYLLHMLEGQNLRGEHPIEQLFRESYRVLSKGGQLIMCEGNLHTLSNGCSSEEVAYLLKKPLKEHGFSSVTVDQITRFKSRAEMLKYFRSSHGSVDAKTVRDKAAFIITAKK